MSRKRAGPAIPDIIAERVFQRADGKEVRALIGRPREAKQDWICEFQILGVGHDKVYAPSGFDSIQALQMALAMMAIQLEACQEQHGLTLDGDPELLLMTPDFDALARRLEGRADWPLWRP